MAVNKVIYGGDTLIDLSGDTVTAQQLLSGVTAHDKAGNKIVGSYSPPSPPSGTLNISANGSYNVHNYANVSVNVPVRYFGTIITVSNTSKIVISGIPFYPAGYIAMPGNFASTRNYTFSKNQEIAFAYIYTDLGWSDERFGISLNGTNETFLVYPNYSVSGSGNNWSATITPSSSGKSFRSGTQYTFRFFGV